MCRSVLALVVYIKDVKYLGTICFLLYMQGLHICVCVCVCVYIYNLQMYMSIIGVVTLYRIRLSIHNSRKYTVLNGNSVFHWGDVFQE